MRRLRIYRFYSRMSQNVLPALYVRLRKILTHAMRLIHALRESVLGGLCKHK